MHGFHCTCFSIYRFASPSPSCILSFFITAVAKGELTEAWKWSEEPKEEVAEGAAKENGHTKSE